MVCVLRVGDGYSSFPKFWQILLLLHRRGSRNREYLNQLSVSTTMPTLYTEIEINASRSRVWQTLTRKDGWKYWNTFLYDCDPHLAFTQGREVWLSVRRLPGESETEFQPIVTLMQPDVCLKWSSSIPGFVNEHVFELQAIGRDRTRYVHQENFSGTLTRLILPFIRQAEQQGIRRMACELKRYSEKSMYQG
jgi:hypothetical protein